MTVKTLSWILNKCCFTEFYFHQRILKKLHFIMQHTNCLSLNVTPNQMKCNQVMCCVTCQSDGLLIYIKKTVLAQIRLYYYPNVFLKVKISACETKSHFTHYVRKQVSSWGFTCKLVVSHVFGSFSILKCGTKVNITPCCISDSICLPQTVIVSVGGLWKLLVWYCKQKNSGMPVFCISLQYFHWVCDAKSEEWFAQFQIDV